MSQRNPLNDRYNTEEHKGKTRRSAASAKPAKEAASSVYVAPKQKTKEERKAIQRAEKKAKRQREAELERKYANPPTEEYRRLRRIWWVMLGAAIVCLALSFFLRGVLGEVGFMVVLVLSYVFIIAALWLEFSKMKKVREAYRFEMETKNTKERRAEERRAKAEAKAAREEAERKFEAAKSAKAEKQSRSLFGGLRKKANEGAKDAESSE